MLKIGVLALQGAFREHIQALESLGIQGLQIRLPQQLSGVDGLIIPGGESTTIGKLAVAYNLIDPIRRLAEEGLPIFGTCAGMILLSKGTAQGYDQPLLGVMDITVQRNGFGRQVDSFETDLDVPVLGSAPFRAIFIRAPYIETVGQGVPVLASLPDGRIVAARERNLLVSAFHPELGDDTRFHAYFAEMARARQADHDLSLARMDLTRTAR
ncbi:MAG: pyridoxal 5'-phosphate synthase glutaminase subunit PdxT [Actinobacteria bacterium]|nr:pyridoxal 5'-phosphate synthase glutaminase subunit PdxT [Actinomycetota bacterium]